MSSRDAVLQRIRDGLAGGPIVEEPPIPEVWPRTNLPVEQLVDRFTEELQAVHGEVSRCGSIDEARQKLAEMIDGSQWDTIGSVERPECREVTAGLASGRVTWAQEDLSPSDMAELAAGLVTADWLLADTGSCVIDCRTPQERLLCYLPPVCIVVTRASCLFEHMPAAWQQIAPKTAEPERRGEFVIVTGPSRTADIEKILILGVHGPKRLVVLLVD